MFIIFFSNFKFHLLPTMTESIIQTVVASMFQKYSRVAHQLDTMNDFMMRMVPSIVEENNTTVIKSKKFKRSHVIKFGKVTMYKPTIKTPNGTVVPIKPHECRKRGLTYSSDVHVDVIHEIYDTTSNENADENDIRVGDEVVHVGPVNYGKLISVRTYREILLCELPVMLQSVMCYLSEDKDLVSHDEDIYDPGGYFIVNGNEKTILCQVALRTNFPYVFKEKRNQRFSHTCEIRSLWEHKIRSTSTMYIRITRVKSDKLPQILVKVPFIKCTIPLASAFRLLGVDSISEMYQYIMNENKTPEMEYLVHGVLEDPDLDMPIEDLREKIGKKGTLEQTREKRIRYVKHIFYGEVLPHMGLSQTLEVKRAKALFFGHAILKLLHVYKGVLTEDDRDHIANKRLLTPGFLCGLQFRQQWRMFLKALNIHIHRAVENGKFFNLPEVISPKRITSGIKYAFSTGNWGQGKAAGMKGVVQMLTRMMGISALSHMRRINTPLNREGKAPEPRQLHPSTMWLLCCVTGDTLVVLENGVDTCRIDQLPANSATVMTVNPKTLIETPSRYYNFFLRMPDTLLKITIINDRVLKCTPDHPLLVSDDKELKWMEAGQLKVGQKVMTRSCNNNKVAVAIESIVEIPPETVYDFTTISDNHSFIANEFVVSNCSETPEGAPCGLITNLALSAHVRIGSSSKPIIDLIKISVQIKDLLDCTEDDLRRQCKIMVNGIWIGTTTEPELLRDKLRLARQYQDIPFDTTIAWFKDRDQLYVSTDAGAILHPVLCLDSWNKLKVLYDLYGRYPTTFWDMLMTEGLIEFVEKEEEMTYRVAIHYKDTLEQDEKQVMPFTHVQISPMLMFGVCGSLIPFPNYNQAPRNMYQCIDSNEPIVMADGRKKPIKFIVVGDVVVTFDPNTFKKSVSKVVAWMTGPTNKPTVLVKTKGGRQIKVTDDHPFMTSRGWKCPREFQLNEILIVNEPVLDVIEKDIVKSIMPIPSILVSDITVENNDHSFITASGFCLHNCSMGKQAVGVTAINYITRPETKMQILHYPQRPIVSTFASQLLGYDDLPCGQNCVVAVGVYTGYNQEDSIIVNQAAIDRGMFRSTIYNLFKDTEKYGGTTDKDVFEKPDQSRTLGLQHANYEKLNPVDGIIDVGQRVTDLDAMIGKVMISGSSQKKVKQETIYRDRTTLWQSIEDGVVDQVMMSGNVMKEDMRNVRVRIRSERIPEIGDKLCLTPDHDVLTNRGWIPIADVTLDDEVACLVDSQYLQYHHPTALHQHNCKDEELYHIASQQVDLMVTANHKMWVRRQGQKHFELIEASSIYGQFVEFQNTAQWIASGQQSQSQCLDLVRKILVTKGGVTVDDFQRLCLHAGLVGTNQFELMEAMLPTNNSKWVRYTGKVYCLTVPSHVFMVRRNGKPVFTGNSSRHGQKGVIGMIYPPQDMPQTLQGIIPDLVINPHCLPSRMTIAHLLETLLGKVSALEGTIGDGTPFRCTTIEQIAEVLQSHGTNRYGDEVMINGMTGEQMENKMFVGVIHYQRLKHQTKDKVHARARGPRQAVTRQPNEGRSRDGGLRFVSFSEFLYVFMFV